MKQDIRDLFKDERSSGNPLPDTHRQEFYNKLKASRSKRVSKLNTNYLLKIAAIVILFVAFTTFIFNKTNDGTEMIVKESPIETQIDAIEKQYLASINEEWHNFIKLAKDESLIERYRNKLDDLDKDYQDISKQFKINNNDILVIEALVYNLKMRLQLLKDIQEHIKVLNQKTEHYETINL